MIQNLAHTLRTEAMINDLRQTDVFNTFSEESNGIIQKFGKVQFSKWVKSSLYQDPMPLLCKTSARRSFHLWSMHSLRRAKKRKTMEEFDALSISDYITKEGTFSRCITRKISGTFSKQINQSDTR